MTEVHRFGTNLNDMTKLIVPVVSDDVDYTDYRFETARLNSFINWPVSFMDPKKLAAAGFYYIHENDKVKCFECYTVLSGWVLGDDPMVEHQRWSGRCRFVRNLSCGNVPIGVDPSTISTPMSQKIDVCGIYGLKYKPYSGPDNNVCGEDVMNFNPNCSKIDSNTEIAVNLDLDSNISTKVKLIDVIGSKHTELCTYERRLRTFKLWPEEKSQKKEDLAAAGFFYIGKGDQTICYYCGIGLNDWEPMDNPVQEHIKWYPECKFIKRVQAKKHSEKNVELDTPSAKRTDESNKENKINTDLHTGSPSISI